MSSNKPADTSNPQKLKHNPITPRSQNESQKATEKNRVEYEVSAPFSTIVTSSEATNLKLEFLKSVNFRKL